MTPVYSGRFSRAIWRRVCAIHDDGHVYNLGCKLQNAEIKFIEALEYAERCAVSAPETTAEPSTRVLDSISVEGQKQSGAETSTTDKHSCPTNEPCSDCRGSGRYFHSKQDLAEGIPERDCPTCNGTGKVTPHANA